MGRVPHDDVAVPQDRHLAAAGGEFIVLPPTRPGVVIKRNDDLLEHQLRLLRRQPAPQRPGGIGLVAYEQFQHRALLPISLRSEEHTSELQSLMRISYAVFCLKKKTTPNIHKQ